MVFTKTIIIIHLHIGERGKSLLNSVALIMKTSLLTSRFSQRKHWCLHHIFFTVTNIVWNQGCKLSEITFEEGCHAIMS